MYIGFPGRTASVRGPLLDERGAPVAVTVSGADGASASINLFISTDDAMRYLGVTLQ